MAEVGLVLFARVALAVAAAVVPPFRYPRSKHVFTQPQLLAILCLMRYEDWTFREAEVRLAEHRELRRALHLRRVPDYTTLCRFLARLDPTDIARVVAEISRRLPPRPGPPRGRRGAIIGVDATGLTTGAVSTYFVRRLEEATGQRRSRAHWLKWLLAVDTARRLIVAQDPHRGPLNDVRRLPGVLAALPEALAVAWVVADREFDREANHQYIHRVLGAESAIPVRRHGAPRPGTPVSGVYRARMARRFPKTAYGQRAISESVFSAVKRKLSPKAPGRSLATQCRQALVLGLAYNVYRLKPCSSAAA
jgi:hypothetical protein